MGHAISKEEAEYMNKSEDIKKSFTKAVGINILMLGPRKGGKSALINQFLNNKYSNMYIPTTRTSLCIFHIEH